MGTRIAIAIVANFILVAGLIAVGFRLFAQYHSRGKWAKNITALLAGTGMLVLALGLLITPQNAAVVAVIAQTKAHLVFVIASSILLLAAMVAYGIITYWKPARLWLEHRIEKEQQSELPRVP